MANAVVPPMTGKTRTSQYYKKKYAKELREGLRADGKTIEHCCKLWGICRKSYYNWLREYPDFAEAAEGGEMVFYIYWYELGQNSCATGKKLNAGVYNFVMTNLHKWQTRTETSNTH